MEDISNRPKATPYHIAEIAYNPAWPDRSWYVVRAGMTPQQGGLAPGIEAYSFETLSGALSYLRATIDRDMDFYKETIAKKEAKVESNDFHLEPVGGNPNEPNLTLESSHNEAPIDPTTP